MRYQPAMASVYRRLQLTPLLIVLLLLVPTLHAPASSRRLAATPGPCEPGYVQYGPGRAVIQRAALHRPVELSNQSVLLEWLGHSSFLLTSPGGLRLLTDPSAWHPPAAAPDVMTVSNLHPTHADVAQVSRTSRVLWGMHPEHGWTRIALTLRDVTLFNVPSYAHRKPPEESPIQNSIFVFRVGGLCLVHLGNLRHTLLPQQLAQLGLPDVVMVPVDGQWNLAYGDIITVITQLQPRLVIPMHIDEAAHAELFVRYTDGRYRVRRLAGRHLALSRSVLPATTEIVLFSDQKQ